ncbi:MAG: hypothetical protein HYZ53_20575 [Planctomycetes bacterium]|nr:hypothetical protein [Planctomycetota bacterium]
MPPRRSPGTPPAPSTPPPPPPPPPRPAGPAPRRRLRLLLAALLGLPLLALGCEGWRYRELAGAELAAAVPARAVAAVRVRDLARAWPALRRSPLAAFVRARLDEARAEGAPVPRCLSRLLDPAAPEDEPVEGVSALTLGRCLEAVGTDVVAAAVARPAGAGRVRGGSGSGSEGEDGPSWCAVTRLSFLSFAAADLGSGIFGEAAQEGGGVRLRLGARELTALVAGGVVVVADSAALAAEVLGRLRSGAATGEGRELSFGGSELVRGWIDLGAAGGPTGTVARALDAIPVRELFPCLPLSRLERVAWQAEANEGAWSLDAALTLGPGGAGTRVMPVHEEDAGRPGAAGLFPARTAWLGLSRMPASEGWKALRGCVRDRDRPGLTPAGDVLRAAYAELEPILDKLEAEGIAAKLVAALGPEAALGVWPGGTGASTGTGASGPAGLAVTLEARDPVALSAAVEAAVACLGGRGEAGIAFDRRDCGGTPVHVLRGGFARNEESLSPTIGVARGHLLLATSYEAMRTLIAAGGSAGAREAATLATSTRYREAADRVCDTGTVFDYADVEAARALARQLAGPLAGFLSDRIDRRELRARLEAQERARARTDGRPADEAALQDGLDRAVLAEVAAAEARSRSEIERWSERFRPLDRLALSLLPDPRGPALHLVVLGQRE